MYVKDLLKSCLIDDSIMKEVIECDKRQIVSSYIPIPVCKVEYEYSDKIARRQRDICYIFKNEENWDRFNYEIDDYFTRYNRIFPDDKRSRPEVIDYEFLGYMYLNFEND